MYRHHLSVKLTPGFVPLDLSVVLFHSNNIPYSHDSLISPFQFQFPSISFLEYSHQEVFIFYVYNTPDILHIPFQKRQHSLEFEDLYCIHAGEMHNGIRLSFIVLLYIFHRNVSESSIFF